jgi:hypothetical protein
MTAQRQAFDPGPALGNLTDREQTAIQLLQARPHGVTSTELGVHIHTTLGVPCACSPASICRWAMTDGETVGKQLRRRKVAFKQAHTHWTLRVAARQHDTGAFPEAY